MLVRRTLQKRLRHLAKVFPVVTVTGPRQSGKTTLCKMAFPSKEHVSLEDPELRDFARQDPRGFLDSYPSGAVLDEVQRVPELLSSIQIIVDETKSMGQFVLTGSANLALLDSVAQSLAGRTALATLLPMSFKELRAFPNTPGSLFETLFQGSYPAIYDRGIEPRDWYASYVGTYVERDVRQILNVGDLNTFQQFLRLCAGRTGQLLNLSSLGSDAGVVHGTIRAWTSILETTYMIHRLPPFYRNVRKRLVKTPKLHFLDSGLLCYLLGIQDAKQLVTHPLRGVIFESWVVAEIFKYLAHRGLRTELCFYRDRKGEEVDLLISQGDRLVAVEVKSSRTIAEDFFAHLERFEDWATTEAGIPSVKRVLVYGGDRRQRRRQGIVLPWSVVSSFDWAAA